MATAPGNVDGFERLPMPRRLVVPLTRGPLTDPPAALAAGVRVRRGEPLVASPQRPHPTPRAPADGTVLGVEPATLTNQFTVPAVVLEVDATSAAPVETQAGDADAALNSLRDVEPGGFIDRLLDASVWADRWTSPDLLGQLHQALRRPVDTIVCSLLDPDPALPVQQTVASSRPADVIAGVAALARMTGANRSWLVIPADAPSEPFDPVRPLARQFDVRVVPTENLYPRAHPTLLLHALAGRSVRPGKPPTEAGALLLDAAAAAAIGAMLLRDEPMLDVPVGLYDRSAERAHLAIAPIGMLLGDLVGLLGISQTCPDLVAGHVLREIRMSAAHVIGAGELTVYAAPPAPAVNPAACIRCAWCVEACPVRIQPAGLLEAAQQQDPELATRYGLESCIECGICTYVCPSNLPLLRGIRTLRRG